MGGGEEAEQKCRYLPVQDVGLRMRLHEVVGPPFHGFHGVSELPSAGHLLTVLRNAPRQHGDGEGHGQPKFYIISGIVVASDEINLQT